MYLFIVKDYIMNNNCMKINYNFDILLNLTLLLDYNEPYLYYLSIHFFLIAEIKIHYKDAKIKIKH